MKLTAHLSLAACHLLFWLWAGHQPTAYCECSFRPAQQTAPAFSAVITVNANTVLTRQQSGALVYLTTSNTVTLPATKAGDGGNITFTFVCNRTYISPVIAAAGSDKITCFDNNNLSAIKPLNGSYGPTITLTVLAPGQWQQVAGTFGTNYGWQTGP